MVVFGTMLNKKPSEQLFQEFCDIPNTCHRKVGHWHELRRFLDLVADLPVDLCQFFVLDLFSQVMVGTTRTRSTWLCFLNVLIWMRDLFLLRHHKTASSQTVITEIISFLL